MRAANSRMINIPDAITLRFSGVDSDGNEMQMRQVTYIADDAQKMLLCKTACRHLALMSSKLPKIGEKPACLASKTLYSYLKTTMPPPLPQKKKTF